MELTDTEKRKLQVLVTRYRTNPDDVPIEIRRLTFARYLYNSGRISR